MSSVIRMVVTCLLALTLPIQGYAASSMLLCGPNHQRHKAPAALAQAHEHAPGTAHHEHPADPQTVVDSAATPQTDNIANKVAGTAADKASTAKSIQPLSGKCSVCAACCNAAAMASAAVVLDLALDPPALDPVRLEHNAGFTPSGLERPPRLNLA